MRFLQVHMVVTVTCIAVWTTVVLIKSGTFTVSVSPKCASWNGAQLNRHNTFTNEPQRVMKQIRDVRVLCWVMTMLKNLQIKTKYVKSTWGKRCDVLLFFGSGGNKKFPVIKVNVTEGRRHLTEKTYAAFRYIYKHYMDKADWFLKADDDTYVLMDNLKYFLSGLSTSKALSLGFTFTGKVPQGYNSGGAGYVLSKEALSRFGTRGNDTRICPFKGGVEDVDIGRCMYNLGVKNVDTLDALNKTRFHSFHPLTHLYASDRSLRSRSQYGYRTGIGNISDFPFTFHYVKGKEMELFELFLYNSKTISNTVNTIS